MAARSAALDALEGLAEGSALDPRTRARLQISTQCQSLAGQPPHAMSELLRPLELINHGGMSLRAPSFAATCLMQGRIAVPDAVEWIAACLRAPLSYFRVLTGHDAVLRVEDVLRDGMLIELAQDFERSRPTPWSVICARIVHFRGVHIVDASAAIAVPSRCIAELRAYARALTRSQTPMEISTLCRHDLALLANFASVVHGEARPQRVQPGTPLIKSRSRAP